MMNHLVNLLAGLLFIHCNAYLVPTLSHFGRAVSSSVSIHHHHTPSLPKSWTRVTDSRTPSPSHSSWCLFSIVDDQGDKRATLPSLDYSHNQVALDYFNNSYFFDGDDDDRVSFVNKFLRSTNEKKKILTMTLDDIFQTVLGKETDNGMVVALNFLRDNLYGCIGDRVLEAYKEWKKVKNIRNQKKTSVDLSRMVNVDFQIKDSALSHTYDLICFSKRIDNLFEAHKADNYGEIDLQRKDKYFAPYFCFVQSSGMGKTKLLYEYSRISYQQRGVTSFVIIPPDTTHDSAPIFPILDLANVGPSLEEGALERMARSEILIHVQKVAKTIFGVLDSKLKELVGNSPCKDIQDVALLFDEAQYLLKEEFGYDAFRFRCVRLWLMEIPRKKTFRHDKNLFVAAVFTGTSSKLTSFLFENDDDLKEKYPPPSRNFVPPPRKYFEKGYKLHSPFCQTTTMGSCLTLLKENQTLSEYERAVYRGRPLFAQMAKEGVLDECTPVILLRMLRETNWTEDNRNGWINLLSTRAQMGQISAEVASDLVANSYANLCAYNDDSRFVHLGYLSDPVPARLAMCMMDQDFRMDAEIDDEKVELIGQNKKWWSKTLTYLFFNEIVRPDKGNSGEILVALYMLWCGDILRKLINDENERNSPGVHLYSQFSVSLDAWLKLMLSGGKFPADQIPNAPIEDSKVSVGFIQVCRNPLRSYNGSWKCLKDQFFLKNIYETGIGFYTCNNCAVIDMVVPIRVKTNEKGNIDGFCYIPMLISIKSQQNLSKKAAGEAFEAMANRVKKDRLTRALCLLIVFGSDDGPKRSAGKFAMKKDSNISEELTKHVVMREIRVPCDDEFGLSAAFDAMIPYAQLQADLFSSHPFLKAHGRNKNPDLSNKKAMYSRASKKLRGEFDALRTAIIDVHEEKT